MGILGQIDTHFWLTRGVAQAAGVSLGDAMAEGRLSSEDYARMVTRCRAGGCAERCAAWLGTQACTGDGPPPFCVHRDQILALRRH